jgi:O-antigen ligase
MAGAVDSVFRFQPYLENLGPLGSYNNIYGVFKRGILIFAAVVVARDVKRTTSAFIELWPLTLSLVWIMVSSVWSIDPWTSFARSTALTTIIVMTVGLVGRHGVTGVMKSIHIAGVIVLVASFALLVIGPTFAFEQFGLGASFRAGFWHKNQLALFLTCFVICLVADWNSEKHVFRLVKDAVMLVGSFILIWQSHSVSGIVISSGAVLIACLLSFHQRVVRAPLVMLTGLFIAVLLVLILVGVGKDALLEGFGRDPTLTGRTTVWELAWQSVVERPILGFGYGSYWTALSGAKYSFGDSWLPPDAHNGFLDALLGGGVVLLTLIIYQTWILIKRSIVSALGARSTIAWFMVLVGALLPVYNSVESIYLRDYSIATLLFVTVLFAHSRSVAGGSNGLARTSREP